MIRIFIKIFVVQCHPRNIFNIKFISELWYTCKWLAEINMTNGIHSLHASKTKKIQLLILTEMLSGRGGSREVSQVSRNQQGLLNWHNIQIHSNKTVNVYGSQSWYCSLHPFICSFSWFFFTRVSHSPPAPLYYHPLQKISGYFSTYALIPLLSIILH